ncbi:hypothetical protein HNY73_002021 [Argiope bruennichi]|uniref:Uncharacterized protein n=1 Tax=Argiope bruennichi TaxID=94029 RepID=A0A8T0FT99_ARGBR|nr:hypothetical protein HNY73_002021 [Argiope bruennichi]
MSKRAPNKKFNELDINNRSFRSLPQPNKLSNPKRVKEWCAGNDASLQIALSFRVDIPPVMKLCIDERPVIDSPLLSIDSSEAAAVEALTWEGPKLLSGLLKAF